MSGQVDEMVIAGGARILVCLDHQLERCHRCFLDFVDMNNDARAEARLRSQQVPGSQSLGAGLLPAGFAIYFPTRNGAPMASKPIYVRGAKINDDEDSLELGLHSYILDFGTGTLDMAPVDDIHDEYKARVVGPDGVERFISIKQYLAGETEDKQFEDDEDLTGYHKHIRAFESKKELRGETGGIPVLIVGGLHSMFSFPGDIYANALLDGFWASTEPKNKWNIYLEAINKDSVTKVIDMLSKFKIVVLAYPSAHNSTFFLNVKWRAALTAWAKCEGNLLAVFGGEGGSLVSLFQQLGKEWCFDGNSYSRGDHKPNPKLSQILPPGCDLGNLGKSGYNVKACRLSKVAASEILFAERNQTAVAYGKCGNGHILFQGDVNFEDNTVAMLKAILYAFGKNIPPFTSTINSVTTAAAQTLLNLKDESFPSFKDLPEYNAAPAPKTQLFFGEIREVINSPRLEITVHSHFRETVRIGFYHHTSDIPKTFSWDSIKVGSTVVVMNATSKSVNGRDMIYQENLGQVYVFQAGLEAVLNATRFLVDAERNLKETCWEASCCKSGKKCSGCHIARYCGAEHQKASWVAGHKSVCKGMEQLKYLCDMVDD